MKKLKSLRYIYKNITRKMNELANCKFLSNEDDQIIENGMYKGLPFWVVLRDDDYCLYIYNRTALPKSLRDFQRYLIKKKAERT